MQSPEEIARLIISQWYKVPNLYFGSEGLQAELNDIAAIVQSYGDERARQERERWEPVEPKPADWDTEYHVTLTGKNLEAMHYLSRFVLDAVRDPRPLPFGVIAAADHLFCLAAAIRALD